MDNQIRYTVTANDMLSGKLQGMNANAGILNSTMGGLSKIMGTLGVGFAVFKGLEFVKAGLEKVHELHQATAQVQAVLTSTNQMAGLSMKELEESAKSLSSNSKFGRADIFGMQSLLLTFTSVKDKIFNEAQPAIMDLATRMGGDLKGASIQVGKALNDPIQGMTALRRVGVSFSEDQKAVIKRMQETGNLAGAQKIILNELAVEFGGSAKAAFDADPMAKFNKMMGSLKMTFGEIAESALVGLMPVFEAIGSVLKNTGKAISGVIEYFKEHAIVAEVVKVFLVSVVSILLLYNAQQKLSAMYTAFTTASFIANTFAMGAMTAGFAGASAGGMVLAGVMALINAVNPFVWIVLGIAVVVTAIYEAYQRFEMFRGIIWAIGAVIKAYVSIWGDMFKGLGIILKGVFTLDFEMVKSGFNKITDTIKGSAKRLGQSAKDGYNAGVGDFAKDQAKEKESKTKKGLGAIKPMTADVGAGAGAGKEKKGTSGVSGSKVVTVNVTIGNLINDFRIQTTNIQESTTAIKDKVLQALTSAVNDSQLTAGN
jgi:diacylglycerol kinase